jgi:hypothetical protein
MRAASAAAWRQFKEQVEHLGGRVIEDHWLGSVTPHRIICGQGHAVSIRPSKVNQTGRICAACSRADRPEPAAAWRRFREKIEARGGHVVEPSWLGRHRLHRIICAAGHETATYPSVVDRPGPACKTCSGNDPAESERTYLARLAEAGGQPLEPYVNSVTPVLVRCAQGHETKRLPSSIRDGHDCLICSGYDKETVWQTFCRQVAERGGQVLEPKPLGSNKMHRVLCPEGHETTARPQWVQRGGGICGECSPVSASRAERKFRRLVAEAGAQILEPSWLGATTRHRVVCRHGHEANPRPNDVDQGHGICRKCECRIWDVFYVVVNEVTQTAKFGITSNDARRRLGRHRADGFGTVIMTIDGLADAPDLEQAVLRALRLAEFAPARGREYFDVAALPVILDIAGNWPAAPGETAA